MFRQGDILVTRIGTIPAGAVKCPIGHDPVNPFVQEDGTVTLALGEVTTHSHRIKRGAELLRSPTMPQGAAVLIIAETASLEHEEHASITLFPGIYRVTRQRQWDSGMLRVVAD